MNERGNRYALAALKDKRATIASEIVQLEQKLRHRKEMLVHVDMCLRLLDPSIVASAIPHKRLRMPKHIKLFRQGELGRLILGAIRKGQGEALPLRAIVNGVIGGRRSWRERDGRPSRLACGAIFSIWSGGGRYAKTGSGRASRWALI